MPETTSISPAPSDAGLAGGLARIDRLRLDALEKRCKEHEDMLVTAAQKIGELETEVHKLKSLLTSASSVAEPLPEDTVVDGPAPETAS